VISDCLFFAEIELIPLIAKYTSIRSVLNLARVSKDIKLMMMSLLVDIKRVKHQLREIETWLSKQVCSTRVDCVYLRGASDELRLEIHVIDRIGQEVDCLWIVKVDDLSDLCLVCSVEKPHMLQIFFGRDASYKTICEIKDVREAGQYTSLVEIMEQYKCLLTADLMRHNEYVGDDSEDEWYWNLDSERSNGNLDMNEDSSASDEIMFPGLEAQEDSRAVSEDCFEVILIG